VVWPAAAARCSIRVGGRWFCHWLAGDNRQGPAFGLDFAPERGRQPSGPGASGRFQHQALGSPGWGLRPPPLPPPITAATPPPGLGPKAAAIGTWPPGRPMKQGPGLIPPANRELDAPLPPVPGRPVGMAKTGLKQQGWALGAWRAGSGPAVWMSSRGEAGASRSWASLLGRIRLLGGKRAQALCPASAPGRSHPAAGEEPSAAAIRPLLRPTASTRAPPGQ